MEFIVDWLAWGQLNPVLKERNRILELRVLELTKESTELKQELVALKQANTVLNSEIEQEKQRADNLEFNREHDKPSNDEVGDSSHDEYALG